MEESEDMTDHEADRTTVGQPPPRSFNQLVGTKKPYIL